MILTDTAGDTTTIQTVSLDLCTIQIFCVPRGTFLNKNMDEQYIIDKKSCDTIEHQHK